MRASMFVVVLNFLSYGINAGDADVSLTILSKQQVRSYGAVAAAPQESTQFCSIIVPAMGGVGIDALRSNGIANGLMGAIIKEPGCCREDLGQKQCTAVCEESYRKHNCSRRHLFFGVSQGGATAINWLATKNHEEQNQIAKLLVVEGLVASGNDTIVHRLSNVPWVGPFTRYAPFVRVWAPVVAKIVAFPCYNPWWGAQAITSSKKLSPDLPVIIIHGKRDGVCPINGARACYCAIKEQGNKNVYLMEVDNNKHYEVLESHLCADDVTNAETKRKKADLQTIYERLNLPTDSSLKHDDDGTPTAAYIQATYQPSIEQVRQRSKVTDRCTRVTRNIIDTCSILVALYLWSGCSFCR